MEWNLRERLEDAKEQRRIAAGLPPTEHEPPPEHAEPESPALPDAEQALADLIVDLRDPASVFDFRPTVSAGVTAGAPQASTGPTQSKPVDAPIPLGAPTPDVAASPAETISSREPTKDRCPHCRGKVRLDMFDLVNAVAHMSCMDCGFVYQAKRPQV